MSQEIDTSTEFPYKPVNVSLCEVASAIQKLKQQNEKLKTEVQSIKSALETALKKQKAAKVESFRQQFAERNLHPADQEMQQLLTKIAEVKSEIESIRADLTSKHEEQALGLESQIKMMKQHLTDLEDEEMTLKKIGKHQRRALGHLQTDKEKVSPQVEQLQQESVTLTAKIKELKVSLSQKQNEWKSAHEQMVSMELKCRAAQQSLTVVSEPELSSNDKELQEWNKKVIILEKAISSEEVKNTKRCEELKDKTAETQKELEELKEKEKDAERDIKELEGKLQEMKGKHARACQRNAELLKRMNGAQSPQPQSGGSPAKKKLGPVIVRGRRQNQAASIRSQSVPAESPDPIHPSPQAH